MTRELTELWTITVGAAPNDLADDLQQLGRFFEPWRQPATLRRMLAVLPPFDIAARLDDAWFVRVANSAIITPEGRIALDRLTTLRRAGESVVIDLSGGEAGLLLDLYRRWSQRTLRKVIDDLSGEGETMYVRSIAAVLVFMGAGAESPETALLLDTKSPTVAAALNEPLELLADLLDQRAIGGRKDRIAGYPLSRARQRLGVAVQAERRAGTMAVWVPATERAGVIDVVVGDLLKRLASDRSAARDAVTQILTAIDRTHSVLVAAGMAAEGREPVRELREDVMAAIANSSRDEEVAA